ncbi:MAG: thiamine-phosphate kinase [Gammaproteobacteria bacterium]
MSEFEIIDQYFSTQLCDRDDVKVDIGDDAAVLEVSERKQLVVSMDTLVSGIHFPENTTPWCIGYKALAVNLSDLAAMGAEPAWMTLALTLPKVESGWLEQFSSGLFSLADQFRVKLIGGDTTRGPLSITIQVHGFVDAGCALLRDRANEGDLVYVTGTLGDAAMALFARNKIEPGNNSLTRITDRLEKPLPRVRESLLLKQYLGAVIDISDGLVADLNHILTASRVGAVINHADIPLSSDFVRCQEKLDELKHGVTGLNEISDKWHSQDWSSFAITQGDDYELCFTVHPEHQSELESLAREYEIEITRIGTIVADRGLTILGCNGSKLDITRPGYNHFSV